MTILNLKSRHKNYTLPLEKYGDVAQLLFVKPDDDLLKAMVRFWDPTYRCFTFNEVDMVLTIEEYSTLLQYDFRDKLRIY
ncbi:hypothetical protein Golob_026247 [Gossypium lobatum]|uniref:DUF7745 domain-containing protein n=1 Tax=Gossypium lobatum TaxID=34289 RepID=A0A7J8LUG9_9ROSI|nr:hypothetical protein [Gossypium lobatum]